MTSERMMRHFYGASGVQQTKEYEQRLEDNLEAAYWEFDTLHKRPGMPMSERDAFKAAVRRLLKDIR